MQSETFHWRVAQALSPLARSEEEAEAKADRIPKESSKVAAIRLLALQIYFQKDAEFTWIYYNLSPKDAESLKG